MRKTCIIKILVEQGVNDREIECIIRSGPDQKKIVCLGSRNVGTNINDRETAAFIQCAYQVIDFFHVDGLKDISALEDHMAGILQIIDDVFPAEAEQGKGGVLNVASAGRIVIAVVGRAQAFHKGHMEIPERPAAIRKENASCTVLGLDALEPVGHKVECVVPGGFAPPPFSPFPFSNHGELWTLIVIDKGRPGSPAGAHSALDSVCMGVALQKSQGSVFHLHLDRATHCTHPTHAVNFFRTHFQLQKVIG